MSDDKRFFLATDDGDCDYYIVAQDLERAKDALRVSGAEFGDPSQPVDQADLAWKELTRDRAGEIRCHTEDDNRGRGVIPLSDCDLGEWFSSEW